MADTTTITAVSPTLHLVQGPAVGWVVLTDTPAGPGVPFTLVDTGYPGYAGLLHGSIAQLGLSLHDLVAVLVTHAHVDHVGGLPSILEVRPEVPVLTSVTEARHVQGLVHESASEADILPRIAEFGVASWATHVLANGATAHVTASTAAGVPDGLALDVPGHPVPFVTTGHTSGHTCYHLPQAGAVLTGDALVTGHPLSRATGPQVLRDFFHHDVAAMLSSLDALGGLDADVVVPGHGAVWHGRLSEAARRAGERAIDTL